jgi:tRNA (mo5U34)-methyltransferase
VAVPGETRDDIELGMAAYQWYHTLELGDGIVTPGQYDHRGVLQHYGLPARVDGKTVIDVGPAQGFFAFELERRGAARVVTVELPAWSSHDAGANLKSKFGAEHDRQAEPYLHGALEFAIRAKGSKVERQFGNIYDLRPESVGVFDLAFCGSLLIHLTDPLRALSALRGVTREMAIVATVIDPGTDPVPRALFYGTGDGQAFWAPNMACLENWLLCTGFRRVQRVGVFELASRDGVLRSPHGVVHAYP